MASIAVLIDANPVTMMTAIPACAVLMCCSSSRPFMPGMTISDRTRSYGFSVSICLASSPLVATSASYPWSSRRASVPTRKAKSSSTIRMRVRFDMMLTSERKDNGERGTQTRLALHFDRSPVQPDDAVADG